MKAEEMRNKSVDELIRLREKLSRDLMESRFKSATGQLNDTSVLGKLSRDVARIETIIREKR